MLNDTLVPCPDLDLATFWQQFHPRLLMRLMQNFPGWVDEQLICDGVDDTLREYQARPIKFHQSQEFSLEDFLALLAMRKIKHGLRGAQRRKHREEKSAENKKNFVELGGPGGHYFIESEDLLRWILDSLLALLRDPQDQKVFRLMWAGVRETPVYAEVLGLDGMRPRKRRQTVKREKERLRMHLKRHGGKLYATYLALKG